MTARILFHASETPRASIVVLAYKSSPFLEHCLSALAQNIGNDVPYEVLLMLNAADDDVAALVNQEVRGARVLSSRVNLGFAGGCNRAAGEARGEYLVLLNDDAEIEPGWLDALVRTADEHLEAGAIGSRFLFPDGTLQEAGSVIFSDGSTAPIGLGEPPGSLAFTYVRKVDYCSAGSLLVRKALWDRIGGLHEGYYPAYYEDTDLCLSIAQQGFAVLYEPRSRVRHHGSVSTDARFKDFLFRRNKKLLVQRWAQVLEEKEDSRPESPEAMRRALVRAMHRARGASRRLLIIDDRIPEEGIGSGFPRILVAVKEILASGRYAISFHPTARLYDRESTLGRLGVEVIHGDLAAHLRAAEVVYDVILMSRFHNYERFADLIRETQPSAALVYDTEALASRRLERQARMSTDPFLAAEHAAAAAACRATEERFTKESDRIVCVSEEEAALLAEIPGHAPIDVLVPLMHGASWTPAGFDERNDMVMVAAWLAGPESPNADGLIWFAREVLPLVRKKIPWVRLLVTGANPPPNVAVLAGPSLSFVGHVADLGDLYARARVAVVPMRIGAGVKLKTIEALQYGVPMVATSVGAEGVDVPPGEAMDVADDPELLARAAVSLLTDPATWERRRREIERLHQGWTQSPQTNWGAVVDAALTSRYNKLRSKSHRHAQNAVEKRVR